MKCCICGKEIPEGEWGNNPEGAVWKTTTGEIEMPEFGAEDRCCDECDRSYVIPGRLYRMSLAKKREN